MRSSIFLDFLVLKDMTCFISNRSFFGGSYVAAMKTESLAQIVIVIFVFLEIDYAFYLVSFQKCRKPPTHSKVTPECAVNEAVKV